MKCPQCNRQHKYSNGGLRCNCGYTFVFSPKDKGNYGIRDGKLIAAIKGASKNGTVVFTRTQLYSAYARNCKTTKLPGIIAGLLLLMFGLFFGMAGAFPGFILVIVGVCLLFASICVLPVVPTVQQFYDCLRRWSDAGRSVDGLLKRPSLHDPPEGWQEADIYDYGVERILIVQHDILVDLMVLNNQHAEQRMLVISETGYPAYLQQQTIRMLAERDDLPVYLLHDADGVGVAMADRVKSLDWLQIGQRSIIDLGFFPDDFARLKRTKNFRQTAAKGELPVDALLLGALSLGLEHCFLTNSTFGEQLRRERQNAAQSTSSFG